MAKEKKEKVIMVTPTGTLSYPWLRTPDVAFVKDGNTPQYKCSIIVPEGLAIQLMGQLDPLVDASYNETVAAAKPQDKAKIIRAEPYKKEYAEDGSETGNIIFLAHSKFKPKVVDSMLVDVPEEITPYGGSTGRMSFCPEPYYMPATKFAGVTLYLQGVQVLKLVSGSGSGGDCGFTAVEDDFDDGSVIPF